MPLLANLGDTPQEIAACAGKIKRTYEASVLVREALALFSIRRAKPEQLERARRALQRANKLNPDDRDAALYLGLEPPRLRTRPD